MLEHALVLVLQGADGAVAGELGRVVELVDVGGLAAEEGLFEQLDDGALEGDDLALELGLGDYWFGSGVLVMSKEKGVERR